MAKPKIPKRIAQRADAIAASISRGQPIAKFKGKRLQHNRNLISIPIGLRWRMIMRDVGGRLERVAVLSHENYSTGARIGGRS